MSFGMWRANGNPNPSTYHPYLSKEGLGAVLMLAPSPSWA